MIEVERKFLVNASQYKEEASSKVHIQQGFLSTDPERTVRVRLQDGKGKITIKGMSDPEGVSRFEWEHEIPENEALQLLNLCKGAIITKTRYKVPCGSHLFEVDVFEGANEGLVIAELELSTPDEPYKRPAWLGKEVTGDPRYYNAQLSINTFDQW